MNTEGVFTALLAGIVIGALGRLIIPGRQAIGWILTFTVGLVGAFAGGLLAEGMDLQQWWQTLIIQALVAALLVLVVTGLVRGSSPNAAARLEQAAAPSLTGLTRRAGSR